MAAYAALVSLMTTLNNIQMHPRVSSFFDHQQIQSLHQIINFLLEFIERSNSGGDSREEEALERRIASRAHGAEDVIESHVVDLILADARRKKKLEASNLVGWFRRKMTKCARPTRYITDCLLDLDTQIEHMNSVKGNVMEFRGAMKFEDVSSASSKPLTTTKKSFMVGFGEKLIQIMDRLTGHQPDLQTVPIVGMGGIGKTTLAKTVFDNLLIDESFDIRAWVTISHEYTVKYVLSELLSCVKDQNISESIVAVDCGTELKTEDHKLGSILHKTLWGRRYLIVLDDMWSLEAWDRIKYFFPNNGQRSRVLITTRIWSVATPLSSSSFEMNFLDEDQSWELFCGNVFLDKGCPPELEEIGKKIVRECKGLPLSIVVIGGLLRNSTSTREYWEIFQRDLNSILMSRNDEHCFKILSLSYDHLPAHLKPCFLYMGVFREDEKIRVSRLIKLFVAEGFLKPKEGQTLEEVADESLNDLVDRNLILADSWKWNGRIKYCKMHDLVREVCLKIGEREKIFHRMKTLEIPADINKVLKIDEREELFPRMKMFDIPVDINRVRRIVFDGRIPWKYNWRKHSNDLPSSLGRTFLLSYWDPLPFKSRLVRVLNFVLFESQEDISKHVNLRYLHWRLRRANLHFRLPSSVSLLWNVHTLNYIGRYERVEAPSEIWYMRQLRHVQFYRVILPDPPTSEKVEQQDDALLPNLHTLSTVENFSFTEEVCKRIPNIKKLGIVYSDLFVEAYHKKCYYYLEHLHKLQSLYCSGLVRESVQNLVLPSSLRKLFLHNCHLRWEELNAFGLSLPHLQVLKLQPYVAMGPDWDCVEGAFPRLKFLHIENVHLIKWTAESSEFFPVLEKLHLAYLSKLEKIPSGIGEILKLGSLHVVYCSVSAAISSLEILEEQLSFGNEDLQLAVNLYCDLHEEESFREKVEMNNFASKNFKFDFLYD